MRKFSRFYVLYAEEPLQGEHKYRQITASNTEDGPGYEVRIFGGDAVISEQDFKADSLDAELYTHNTAEEANQDADSERDQSLNAGWVPYLGEPL